MERREWLLLLSILVTIVMVGIPQATAFYPPSIQAVASWVSSIIPTNIIIWVERFSIASFGVSTGWLLKSVYSLDDVEFNRGLDAVKSDVDSDEFESMTVHGCVESDGVLWSGEALVKKSDFQNAGRMEPYCPQCKTGLTKSSIRGLQNTDELNKDIRKNKSSTQIAHLKLWDCPACEFHTEYSGKSAYKNAMAIFQTHLEILSTPNQDSSIESIYNDIVSKKDNEPNPKEIWMQYVSKSDANKLSTDCFHYTLEDSF